MYRDPSTHNAPEVGERKILHEDCNSVYKVITYNQRIYDFGHKHYNYCASYYTPNDKVINPKMILRFDCKQINAI